MGRTICVRTFGSRGEAEIARSVLEADGIEAIVSADDCGGMRPELAFTRGVALLVLEEDAERAMAVLERSAEE